MALFRECPLPSGIPGKLWLHSMPGRNEDWESFSESARAAKIGGIACMTSREEIADKSPSYSEALAGAIVPCQVVEFAIPPGGVPDDVGAFSHFLESLIKILREGQGVLVHCTGGVGRTGFVAICLLHSLGLSLEDATTRVKEAGSGPETEEQLRYLSEQLSEITQP
mmetsp:Transcript_97284/g.135170  ORF Transcript_97284/g.135170 Transcript_97284/m.135170 type:complete len:167 (+) Transcript_97284:55-555(+)